MLPNDYLMRTSLREDQEYQKHTIPKKKKGIHFFMRSSDFLTEHTIID